MNVAITEDAHALLEKLPLEEEALTEADSTATASAELLGDLVQLFCWTMRP